MAFFGADETGDTVFLNREVAKDAKGYLILPRSGGDPGGLGSNLDQCLINHVEVF